jgi:hypothetical protein
MAQNLKGFLRFFELTVWVIRRRPKDFKKSLTFSVLVVLGLCSRLDSTAYLLVGVATIQLINLG